MAGRQRTMKIYLSGGMKNSNWQLKVENECNEHHDIKFINPRNHGFNNPKEYTVWDLEGVKNSDVVFAYLERDNPSGFGLTLEVGYAIGLGKTVILIDEKDNNYTQIIRSSVSICFDDLDKGIEFLKSLSKVYDGE